jgi:uncharacterized protein YbjT (DUF2867 family)
MMITVLGATGKTGRAATEQLLAKGVQVQAVARSAGKLGELEKKGARTAAVDIDDPAALTAALRGSDAVYALIPSDYHRPDLLGQYARTAGSIVRAVSASGVRRVALLSSLGAELSSGTGPIAGLHAAEEQFKTLSGVDLLLLRGGYFYQNHLGSLGLIKSQGVNGSAIAPDTLMGTIEARDIGVIAADALASADFSGVTVRELRGPKDLTMTEATRILGTAIGNPELKYLQFPDDAVLNALEGAAGMSKDAARLFVEMSHAFNEGKVRAHQPRTASNTGPTTFEAFAQELARAYRAD